MRTVYLIIALAMYHFAVQSITEGHTVAYILFIISTGISFGLYQHEIRKESYLEGQVSVINKDNK